MEKISINQKQEIGVDDKNDAVVCGLGHPLVTRNEIKRKNTFEIEE